MLNNRGEGGRDRGGDLGRDNRRERGGQDDDGDDDDDGDNDDGNLRLPSFLCSIWD